MSLVLCRESASPQWASGLFSEVEHCGLIKPSYKGKAQRAWSGFPETKGTCPPSFVQETAWPPQRFPLLPQTLGSHAGSF